MIFRIFRQNYAMITSFHTSLIAHYTLIAHFMSLIVRQILNHLVGWILRCYILTDKHKKRQTHQATTIDTKYLYDNEASKNKSAILLV